MRAAETAAATPTPGGPPLRRVVVGTAGHVDHGKTRLIEALTGIDCDRWREEKERGITIDIGFAHLLAGDLQLGFVDVPGHERFVHNALAGLGGIRVVLLVVAADEGVRAQTREHVEICRLLGIPHAVVALTKIDLAGGDLADLAELEVGELLAGGPWEGAPVVRVSALDGTGLAELRQELVAAAGRSVVVADPERPARLPVDRAFLLKGLGTVVTGTLAAGTIAVGDELEALPGGDRARVRSIQVHGAARPAALPGERTSLQLSGVDLAAVARGTQLLAPGSARPTHSLLVRYRVAAGARAGAGWQPVRLHLLASDVGGRLRPVDPPALAAGEEGLVEIRLERPVVAVRGDRLVARRPSPVETLGGGTVLDPRWHRRRGDARAEAARALDGETAAALEVWVEEAGEAGATTTDLARRLGKIPPAVAPRLEQLAGEGRLLRAGSSPTEGARWVGPRVLGRVAARAQRVLRAWAERERLAEGIPKAEAVRRILRGRGAHLADLYLEWLGRGKVLAVDGDRVTLPGRRAALSGAESGLAEQVLATYEEAGLTPPSPAELAQRLAAKPKIFEGVMGFLVSQGRLVRLPGGLVLSRRAFDRLIADLRATGWQRFSVPQFKDRFGLSRKWAIPLLEQLDSVGATRRAGDERLVVGS